MTTEPQIEISACKIVPLDDPEQLNRAERPLVEGNGVGSPIDIDMGDNRISIRCGSIRFHGFGSSYRCISLDEIGHRFRLIRHKVVDAVRD
jgi:hypothetical protein